MGNNVSLQSAIATSISAHSTSVSSETRRSFTVTPIEHSTFISLTKASPTSSTYESFTTHTGEYCNWEEGTSSCSHWTWTVTVPTPPSVPGPTGGYQTSEVSYSFSRADYTCSDFVCISSVASDYGYALCLPTATTSESSTTKTKSHTIDDEPTATSACNPLWEDCPRSSSKTSSDTEPRFTPWPWPTTSSDIDPRFTPWPTATFVTDRWPTASSSICHPDEDPFCGGGDYTFSTPSPSPSPSTSDCDSTTTTSKPKSSTKECPSRLGCSYTSNLTLPGTLPTPRLPTTSRSYSYRSTTTGRATTSSTRDCDFGDEDCASSATTAGPTTWDWGPDPWSDHTVRTTLSARLVSSKR
ncbi:hypothetical protein F5Y19DRAFT_443230 [Xylariaceae sp. FL1651]|nr:hypothetical protein F5Y19DRAFT_443230 [Xylariaceae sp. FL1651]